MTSSRYMPLAIAVMLVVVSKALIWLFSILVR